MKNYVFHNFQTFQLCLWRPVNQNNSITLKHETTQTQPSKIRFNFHRDYNIHFSFSNFSNIFTFIFTNPPFCVKSDAHLGEKDVREESVHRRTFAPSARARGRLSPKENRRCVGDKKHESKWYQQCEE